MSRTSNTIFFTGALIIAVTVMVTRPPDRAPAADGEAGNWISDYEQTVERVLDEHQDTAKGRQAYSEATREASAGSYMKAIGHFQLAMLWDRNNMTYRLGMIDAYRKAGFTEQAWDQVRRARDIAGNNPDAIAVFEDLWIEMGSRGAYDFGRYSSEVRESLGDPDHDEVTTGHFLWTYGFKQIRFEDDMVTDVTDLRGSDR